MSNKREATVVRMTPYTQLTSSERIGVTLLLPHASETVTDEEALEIAAILDTFAASYRRGIEQAIAIRSLAPTSKGGDA